MFLIKIGLVKIPDGQMLVLNIFLQPYQHLFVEFFIHQKSLPILINQVKKILEAEGSVVHVNAPSLQSRRRPENLGGVSN